MANQPTKYRKFLVGAASAALVASAVAPVASAATPELSDVQGNTHAEGINALIALGAISGYPDGTFKPNQVLTRSDVVKMMGKYLVALGQEIPGDFKTVQRFNDLPLTANEELLQYAALVKDAGVFNGTEAGNLDPTGKITRENMALVLVRAFDAILDRDLVAEVAATTFNKEVTDLASAKTEAHGAINVLDFLDITTVAQFNPKGSTTRGHFATFLNNTIKAEAEGKLPAEIVTEAKVESVNATNLKEVVLTFNTAVDKATAGEAAYYSITGVNTTLEIDKVVVADDAKSVTVTVKETFVNQSEYKISFNNIKVGDKVLSAKDLAFKPLDNTVPTVSKVEALGNKTVRVSFSEPVKTAQTSQFKIDDKVVVGSIQTAGNTAIIKLSSTLPDGEHTLTAEGIQDFNNFRVVKSDTKFNVVEDKVAPTVLEVVSASFEKVVLKFSEPVEQVFASNIYWMQGADKKPASKVKKLSDDTFEFEFIGTNKLVYTTDLFVTNVKDYSGNVIDKDTKVQVSPVIDQTRPEVLSTSFVKGSDNKKIVLKFSKSLDSATAGKASNYVLKDKDGKTQAISSTVVTSVDKEVTITVLNTLKDDSEYTLTVNGVSDNTTLKNVMLPYTTTLSVKDTTAPELNKVTRLNDNQLYVEFSEAMATSGDGSIVDASKYTVTVKDGAGRKEITPTSFNVTGDSKGVILGFDTALQALAVATADTIQVKVELVKDVAGNYLKNLTTGYLNVEAPAKTTVKSAVATAKDKVEVEFTSALQSLNASDFAIDGSTSAIAYAELSANGKVATFTLNTNLYENAKDDKASVSTSDSIVFTVVNTTSVDILGERIVAPLPTIFVGDEIRSTVDTAVRETATPDTIVFTFNEAVKADASATTDFTVKDKNGNTVTVAKVTASGNKVTIELESGLATAGDYVTISATGVRFVTDIAGNKIADINARTIQFN